MDKILMSKSEKDLLDLQKRGALTLDMGKVPAYLAPQSDPDHLSHLLRSLIKGTVSNNKDLENITEEDLNVLVQRLHPSEPKISTHFITPPSKFGDCSLSDSDLSYLRNLRKDYKDSFDIEAILLLYNKFMEERQHRYTEKAVIDAIHILMPPNIIGSLNVLKRRKNLTLREIYSELCETFGTTKSTEILILEIYKAVKDSKSTAELLNSFTKIINETISDIELINKLLINETKNYMRTHLGSAITNVIDITFNMGHKKDFRALAHICQSQFHDDIQEKTKKVHNINTDCEVNPIVDSINNLISTLKDNMQPQSENRVEQPPDKACFNCKLTGHLFRDCPSKIDKQKYGARPKTTKSKFSGQKLAYNEAKCVIHINSTHLNNQCNNQKKPCEFKPNHNSHLAGDCRRPMGSKNDFNPNMQTQNHPFPTQNAFMGQVPQNQFSHQFFNRAPQPMAGGNPQGVYHNPQLHHLQTPMGNPQTQPNTQSPQNDQKIMDLIAQIISLK